MSTHRSIAMEDGSSPALMARGMTRSAQRPVWLFLRLIFNLSRATDKEW